MVSPILVMGATSGIGALVVEEAATRGLAVRAFGRSADKLTATDLIEPCVGDAMNAEDVRRATKDARAVIYCLGIKERLAMLWEEERLFSESTRILLDVLSETGPKRLIVVTGFGAGRSSKAMSRLESFGHKLVLGRPYDDKDRQEALIQESELDWTIARPVILTNNKKSGRIRVLREPAEWRNGLIARADVASYLVDAVEMELDFKADVVLAR